MREKALTKMLEMYMRCTWDAPGAFPPGEAEGVLPKCGEQTRGGPERHPHGDGRRRKRDPENGGGIPSEHSRL